MDLTVEQLRQTEDLNLSLDERVERRCLAAKEFVAAGNYEAARDVLSELWPHIGQHPKTSGLRPQIAAEALLLAGVLTGYLGSSAQYEGLQETAKDFISESIRAFESLEIGEQADEARVELALCYWREGALDESRVLLREVLGRLSDRHAELKAEAMLRLSIVEWQATRLNEALNVLNEAAPLFERTTNFLLKGKFHNQRALVLRNLGESEQREDYTDRALMDYVAASVHFEQAGHLRYGARVENNLGFLLFTVNRFAEAHEHLERARQLFERLNDSGSVAQVKETRARAFLAESRYAEAEKWARAAVQTFDKGDEQSLLALALRTQGTALARLGRAEQAQATLQRAVGVAERTGDVEGAGLATLTIIEEMATRLSHDQMVELYSQADELLSRSQHPGVLKRLRQCARHVLAARQRRVERTAAPEFIYAAERTREILREAQLFAMTAGPMLLTGETGTGKEVLARLIHSWSGRSGRMVTVNCAALSETLFESQVFGHKKGSFTDAHEDTLGAVRVAACGTLFLDEISELSLSNQAKLLRLIEFGEMRSLGDAMVEQVDVRIIASTNNHIPELIASGKFREDLFYRLQTFHVRIPPLRQRTEDIPALAAHFLDAVCAQYSKSLKFDEAAIEMMRRLPLRGNARELRALVERMVLALPDGAVISAETVETIALRQPASEELSDPWEGFSLKEEIHRIERRFIELALKDAHGKVSHAARLLGYKHHESLNSLLKSRHRGLLTSRKPVTPRRRSIIRKPQ